jgi:endonuclease/exonuclease/phosphatase family metal-dependent hydrolase
MILGTGGSGTTKRRPDAWCRHLARLSLVSVLVLVTLRVVPHSAYADELKVATWNLDWLTLRPVGAPGIPADVVRRDPDDLSRLATYAQALHADVIAVQEVDGWNAAARIFPRDQYSIHMTRDHVVQRVGIIVRRGIRYDQNPDVIAIETDPARHLRSGADVTLHLPNGPLRVLAVHLKRGCQDQPLERSKRRTCVALREQIEPLKDWIRAREADGIPYMILGDFNRSMDGRDQFFSALQQAGPIVRLTAGHSSPCWGAESFIDHIMLGGEARDWIVPDSLRVLVYSEQGAEWKDRLSDHCPVSARLAIPVRLPAPDASPSVSPITAEAPGKSQ